MIYAANAHKLSLTLCILSSFNRCMCCSRSSFLFPAAIQGIASGLIRPWVIEIERMWVRMQKGKKAKLFAGFCSVFWRASERANKRDSPQKSHTNSDKISFSHTKYISWSLTQAKNIVDYTDICECIKMLLSEKWVSVCVTMCMLTKHKKFLNVIRNREFFSSHTLGWKNSIRTTFFVRKINGFTGLCGHCTVLAAYSIKFTVKVTEELLSERAIEYDAIIAQSQTGTLL